TYEECEILEMPVQEHFSQAPPDGLYSMEYFQLLSEHLQIDPVAAVSDAESLYLQNLLSYPRTSSTKFPADLDVYQLFNQIQDNLIEIFGSFAVTPEDIIPNIQETLERGKAIGNHVPIIPTGKAPPQELKNTRKGKVYQFICYYFMASFMKPYEYVKETVTFSIGGKYKFYYSFYKTINEGFTKALPCMKVQTIEEEIFSKHFIPGKKFHCSTNFIPVPHPRYFSESMLIKKMEEYNIGTDGSVPEHLKNLRESSYAVVVNTATIIDEYRRIRQYLPTALGIKLIEAYERSIPELIDPAFRGRFIQEINDIAAGNADFNKVFDKYLNLILKHYKLFSDNFNGDKMLGDFEKFFKLKPPPPEELNNDPKLKVLLEK
uniref:DNA topoisomerase n=1 Tax=Panagrolaimus sp. ES5 TaxID=591445 RepID=A0AC34G9V0_9BILA